MNNRTTELSTTDVIKCLYETIWAISDSIGVNLEVADGRIPQQNIDAPALAKRLLVGGMKNVGRNLELLRQLDERLQHDQIDT